MDGFISRRRRRKRGPGFPALLSLSAWFMAADLARAQGDAQARDRSVFGRPAAPLDEPLVTDRPDFTESTDAVPFGRLQIEMGYTFTYDREHDERTRDHTGPELLIRAGLFDNFELRIGWDGYAWSEDQFRAENRSGRPVTVEDWTQAANDLSLGFKYKFFEQEGLRPHFGVIGEVSLPSGSSAGSSGDVDPQVVLLWAYDLSDRLALAGNFGIGAPTEDGDRFAQASGSVSLAAALTGRLGGFVEYFGLYPNAEHADCAHSLDGGLTYLINDNLQVDWRVGLGINEEADDFFTGVGFAWRF